MNIRLNYLDITPIDNIILNKRNLMMSHSFVEKQESLNNALTHAFRYGTSAFRFGLIPQGISDHLPIVSQLPLKDSQVSMLSWNLLADEPLV